MSVTLGPFREHLDESTSIHLHFLDEAFSQPVRLHHPREIYNIYRSLNLVTDQIAKRGLEDLSASWSKTLDTLHNRPIYRIGLGYTSFDASYAKELLQGQAETTFSCAVVDLSMKENLKKVVDYATSTDFQAFGACFSRGFLESLLSAKEVQCFAATDKNGAIVGLLWGFFTADQKGHSIFHAFELSRKPTLAALGLGKQLIDFAKSQKEKYPDLKFATLNVESKNTVAYSLYEKEGFALNHADDEKKFMAQNLTQDASEPLLEADAKKIVRNFVLKAVPLPYLICYELSRQVNLLWRSLWYR